MLPRQELAKDPVTLVSMANHENSRLTVGSRDASESWRNGLIRKHLQNGVG